ncbi:MAG: hypothetical protein B6241_13255 [Spirochaetaceae bacterium 4572_59]|nr:MAG: hypothetical protein B6241_13255 [Spirochaetaceae bacterium 4572_59]
MVYFGIFQYIPALANGGKDGWTLEVLQGVICPNFYGANDFFNELTSGKTTFTDVRYKESLKKLLNLRRRPRGLDWTGFTGLFPKL